MKRVTCTFDGLSQCADTLDKGGIVVFPTDTVYGIGCSPFNQPTVERVFRIKHRDAKKPLPVLVGKLSDAEKLVDLGEKGRLLAQKYWPGPVTIVAPLLDKALAPKITAGTNKLAVRIPDNKCILSLLQRSKFLVGTSANLAGHASPKSADEVLMSGLEGYDMLLDGGPVGTGSESTIVDITNLTVTREAAVSAEEISRLLGAGKL